MAPRLRSVRPTQNGQLNTTEMTNGKYQPPPSTIAAQIVHNRANVARQEPENKALFGKLLQEYLRDPIAEDSSVETNAQLIQVVAEAGLDVMLFDDPFAPANLLEQAKDSLLVIRLTVMRRPEVLQYSPKDADEQPPLLLCVLAKILKLLGRRSLQAIQDDLCILLSTLLAVLLSKNRTLHQAKAFENMLCQLIEDVLQSLESINHSDDSSRSHFHATIPSAIIMSAVWPQTSTLLVLPRGYQADIRDTVEAQSLVVQLLAVLDGCHQRPKPGVACRKVDENWVIESCYRVLDVCSAEQSMSGVGFDYVNEQVSNLLRLHVHGRCPKRRIGPIVELLISIIESVDPQYNPRSITAVTAAIAELLEAYTKNSGLRAYLQQRVAPLLQKLAARVSNSSNFDLQNVLQHTLGQLSDQPHTSDIDSRPSKRLRLSHREPDANDRVRHALVEDISEQLSGERASVLPDLGDAAMSKLRELDDDSQVAAITNIGQLPCVLDKSITLVVEGQETNGCKVCDSIASGQQSVIDKDSMDTANLKKCAEFLGFIVKCVEDTQLKRSKRFRIVCANSLRRLTSHINSTDYSLLAFDGIGHWLMRSLQSSIRELRVAAAQALVPYLRDDLPQDVRQRNRIDTLDFLKRLADKDTLHVQETLTFAWSLIGRTCGGPELNIALIQLVDYLGHSHPLISGAAYHEIIQLAQYRSCTPAELIRPYWKSLAIHVVKDVYLCPQKIQQLSDVLCMTVGELLVQTQTETIPYLIVTRKRDVLQRIAQARGPNTNVHDLWLQPSRNIAAVLAFLLVQPSEDPEQNAIALLREASPDFAEVDLSGLVKLEPIQTACEILKYAADYADAKKGHAHQGLRLLAQINERKPGASKTSRSSKMLGTFLEAHILGIMSHFTDIIDTPTERQPLSEKRRALSAVEQLIMVGGSQIAIAIPQIRATLQSASKIPDLVDPVFITWSALVATASEEEVESLIDQTFAVIIHHWNSFGSSTQTRAYDTIAGLLKNYNIMIRDRIHLLPSLAGIEILQKFESEICRLKNNVDPILHFEAYTIRCGDENTIIVRRALQDLGPFLELHQGVIHDSAISQQPSPVIARLSRVLLDAIVRFKETDTTISELAAKCLGAIGSIDPNKVDESRARHDILMLSNFEKADEVINFVVDFLDRVLVDAFHSAPTGKAQTYLAYAMQELLKFCGFRQVLYKARSSQAGALYDRWVEIPEATRSTLTPFFNTRYALVHPSAPSGDDTFPILRPGMSHGTWLRTFVFKLLHQATTENTGMIFPVLSRIIWGHDISIPTFLLPFVVLNIVVDPNDQHTSAIVTEFLRVLSIDLDALDDSSANEIKQCSENIFNVLDYLSRWLQAKRKHINELGSGHSRSVHIPDDYDELKEISLLSSVEAILSAMPADIISRRAVHCHSYARALLHWEQHIRQGIEASKRKNEIIDMDDEFRQLQDIYARIEEPDGVEGMSTRLQILDPEQQILEHKRAGRWTAAQSWYELALTERPDDRGLQVELLKCLKSSNRFGMLLDAAQTLAIEQPSCTGQILPFVAEASWATGRWDTLERFLMSHEAVGSQDFNVEVGKIFMALKDKDTAAFESLLSDLRVNIARGISTSSTASLSTAHPLTIKLHALYEIEKISAVANPTLSSSSLVDVLSKRLDILGAFTSDKQYLLGVRRAAMQLSMVDFPKQQLGANWLASARLSRKGGLREAAYDAVLHATNLKDGEAMIEHSRLLWQDGHHRKAIQSLEGAIESNAFQSYTTSVLEAQTSLGEIEGAAKNQNSLVAKTQLLLAKWMDKAGHSKSEELRAQFLQACKSFTRWEKGHYYVGKHYLKLLDLEKALPRGKQSDVYLTGDIQKLVIENFMRSMVFGAKYLYETVPKMLTLWLDLAAEIYNAEKNPRTIDHQLHGSRVRKLETVHKQVKKYILDRLPSYIFYAALPQITSRINHAHAKANEVLLQLISKIVTSHPQQTLWTILAVAKSRAADKASKAAVVLNQLKRTKPESSAIDIKSLIMHGEKLTHALLAACEVNVESRSSRASLQRDLGFPHKLAPCQLVVPVEKALSANLPFGTGGATIRNHKAFPRVPVTISSFQDDVLVLSSLQRPKKLTMRGSDGGLYGVLCKPKDDLRKDQRLMEFTTMIDRGLKHDVESSKRRLYIHTYAVTPLNEECGAIEWVDGLKPMRDIILANYKVKGVRPDYIELRQLLDKACGEQEKDSWKIFSNQIIPKFPPVLHEWFLDTFPEPDSWFTARMRYTRSCAVMSMVGNSLGLGDRHGENILLEEGNGGCFHVDFNCLFDKGLTFEKPELVPFRMTHNVVDAFGVYGYEGPFRRAAELTLKTLKEYEDTLMTIMETFIYDPTTDFIAKPKKKVAHVPETPAEVLESVRAKINGLLPGETVPLSVEGYADALIKMAIDPKRLSGMYIGWCAFF